MSGPTAADIMSPLVVTLTPEDDIYSAMRTLLKKRLSGAPVIDRQGTLVGMLSEKDCLRILTAEAFDGLPQGTVAGYMTSPVETVKRDTSVYDIVTTFLGRSFRRMPVLDDGGHVVGLVTRRDLLVAIESMTDNSYLYGTEDQHLPLEESAGVDSAMRRARSQKD